MLWASGLSVKASAEAYGIAYDSVYNLLIVSAPFVPLANFETFTALSSTRANLNGVPALPDTDFGGGPVDAEISVVAASLFPGVPPANNSFTAIGRGGNYAYGDAQVSQTALTQANLFAPVVFTGQNTQAWNIAEANIAENGNASARGSNGSNTGFRIEVTIDEPARFTFQFNSDPYMAVLLSADAAGTVNANIDTTFSITGAGGPIFEWSPSGSLTAIGGTVALSPFDLNGSIDVGTLGASAEFDPCDNGAPDGTANRACSAGENQFRATSDLLPPGTYTISLNMAEDVDMITAVQDDTTTKAVPVWPGIWLWLTGLLLCAVVGLRQQVRRSLRVA